MPIKFSCPSCSKRLNAPDSAAGKTAKCPGCGKSVTVPRVEKVYDAEEIVDGLDGAEEDWEAPDDEPDLASLSEPDPGDDEVLRKPCPMCGEEIAITAKKCRFCGELIGKKKGKAKKNRNAQETDMDTSDWLLAVLCSGIGCILGIVYLVQGKPKGVKMLAVSFGMIIFWNVLRLAISVALRM